MTKKRCLHYGSDLGYYLASAQTESNLNSSTIESMTKHIVSELNDGAYDCPDVKCGLIGEVGCSYPLHGREIQNYY